MKSSYLRAGLALLCAVILSACGGNDGNLALSGTIQYFGPAQPGLVLINKSNGEKLTIDTGVTSFVFTKLLAQDEQFDVEVAEPAPSGATCVAKSNTGKANIYTAYYVVIECTTNPFTLGGTVKGLTRGGGNDAPLMLANGSDTVAVYPKGGADVPFTFPTKVAKDAAFGATVYQQPTGQTCKVESFNNPGTMPNSDALGLIVTCQ